MKRETLEEAAERLFPIILEDGWDKNKQYRNEWVEGAKWQQERSYSEEEVVKLLIKFNQEIQEVENVREWFEEFKKK